MQPTFEQNLKNGIAAYKVGDTLKARKIFAELVRVDPGSETAWLWLAACVESDDQKSLCLNRALAINPQNEEVRRALGKLEKPPLPTFDEVMAAPTRSYNQPGSLTASPATSSKSASQISRSTPASSRSQVQRQELWRILIVTALILAGLLLVAGIAVIAFNMLPGWPSISTSPTQIAALILITESSPTVAVQPSATWTRHPPTSTPNAKLSCQTQSQAYSDRIAPKLQEFNDAYQLASSTPRISLGDRIQELQRIRRSIADVSAPDCARQASNLVLSGLDNIINGFIDFLALAGEATVQRETDQGILELGNGLDQLSALAAGHATPVPKVLPTGTPLPTAIPTATPLPAGSAILVEDTQGVKWQITVERIEVADTLTASFSDDVEKAAGRFALVFLSVTNRGLSPETFVAWGILQIQDAEGRRYDENSVASFLAETTYDTDIGASINPDQTAHVVAVYDISRQSAYYVLVPGTLADPYTPSVLLNMP